ncbi:uncharacterized protein N7479_004525 [Penicillium vulpinum]|uniref:MIT domain-containing protein n=1 Tax=Penicillium vulpinum TaxID=29845 RepID=A0A1V6RRE0_9EURO|nr:uncharacterized protein N7479_004525 [Penicillium vulpinum]KAJ5964649.1 hypothetical protein N7479_004525 [Penicillium vulpinum]OQE04335.1 hypothetical protein PENVUL_c034G06175 [Penicillium vulpinum]
MIHHTAMDDDPNASYLRRPSGPFASESLSGPPPNRPSSRSSRPSSRTRMVKPPGAVTPTGLGVLTENVANLSPEGVGTSSPIKEGLGSLNRWSQSTASSKSPSEYIGHHRRGSSKMSMSGYNRGRRSHSPQRAPGPNGLPMLDLPELENSAIFNNDSTSQQLDLSFTASSHLFQPSTHSLKTDISIARTSGGSIPLNDGEGDPAAIQHGQTQKVMLSKALQKANTAVLLDNAANFEGAMEAYTDACNLLQLVMLRSNGGDEEKLKLQEIRDTYMLRVTELHRMDFPLQESDDKALPDRPLSQESYGELLHSTNDGSHIESQQNSPSSSFGFHQIPLEEAKGFSLETVPPRRQSLKPSALEDQPRSIVLPAGSQDEINESTSWLDTIDESGGSSPSSANSKASSVYLRRRTSRRLSNDTEAEFDAALDAAVEAAYDEGLEPVLEHKEEESDNIVSNARRNIQLAKQRVREAEQEAEAMNRDREMRQIQEQTTFGDGPLVSRTSAYLDDEAEEEERLLEEMTKGYVMDDFEFGIQSKSALPRESDSSNMSGRTWESSATSHIANTGGALSTLAEDDVLPLGDLRPEPYTMPSSPPSSALPPLPASSDFPAPSKRASISNRAGSIGSLASSTGPGVRARRLSSQTRELKIETNTRSSRTNSNASSALEIFAPLANRPPPLPKDESSAPGARSTLHPTQRNLSVSSFTDHVNLPKARTHEDDENELPPLPLSGRPMGKVPSAPDGLNKLHSNTKPFRARNASVPIQIPDMCPESPSTPWSGAFPDTQRGATSGVPILPTPTLANFNFNQNGLPSGGVNLFGSNIHSPTALGRPNSLVANAPLPLEPCPESFLLRPFWLMRCLYQTLAHPHGGYLSEKLFIPRDVWRVKNVKLKALEEKVSNCDLLTAALLKLAQVNTYDADAVLEEMQSFDTVLDQVQVLLTKKLGSEVGVQASMPLFKPASTPDEPVQPEVAPNKSYLTWKRLRAKTSGLGTTTPVPSARESNKENLVLNSVPMTSVHGTPAKRNVTQLEFSGPNANYMGALARLFDAAQVLEQIAQQVEDPGLKHSSKTHVGLELSTRHAAEFFGFYICRFALGDVSLMLDKFIKRGSEWVLV